MAMGKSNAPPARAISSASRAPGPDHGAWRQMISSDLAISRPSETNKAISQLRGFMQLAKPGKLPGFAQAGGVALITSCFFVIEHATAQGGGNAHHAIELLALDKGAPGRRGVLLIL